VQSAPEYLSPASQPSQKPRTNSVWFALAVLLLMLLATMGMVLHHRNAPSSERLLLLPMIGALDNCLFSILVVGDHPSCDGDRDSAARAIENTLQLLGPQVSADGQFEVGYTLNVPLLRLFVPKEGGGWEIDRAAARRVANTIRHVKRPMVLYLFSTHFGVRWWMELHLAQDPANFAYTIDGPLKLDKHYDVDVLPWSVASTTNELTSRRKEAMQAVLQEVCALDAQSQSRIQGVTILGEVHQLFPGFESGMGYDSTYRITDYSDISKADFKTYLQQRFDRITALNEALGSDYSSFDAVEPPALDIRKDRLKRFHDHIDAYAGGVLPVSGWAQARENAVPVPAWVRVFVNGRQVARVPAKLGRQDVLAAMPALGTADVGWRHDLHFADWAPGFYRITTALDRGGQELELLGSKMVAVGDRSQSAPRDLPQVDLPPMVPARSSTRFWVDTPTDQTTVYYNPLVPLWHAFRGHQVAKYIQYHAKTVQDSCIGADKVYTHQIIPFTNPGWDSTRFAIDESLGAQMGMRLGISLYGEPTYGSSVTDWIRGQRGQDLMHPLANRPYGITEFHPLKPLSPDALRQTFLQHHAAGAQFVSFFMDVRTARGRLERGMGLFSFAPENPEFGADVLFRSVQDLMVSPPATQDATPSTAGVLGANPNGVSPQPSAGFR
jgi:hypothetical protein